DTFRPSDLNKHKNALEEFEKEKGSLGDINQYKHVGYLNHAIATKGNAARQQRLKEKFGEKVFDKENHQIWKIHEPEHACNHGEKTGWCTRIKDGDHQKMYMNQGTLYAHYPPGTPKPGEDGHGSGHRFQFFVPKHNETELE